jgi:DNA-binding transcriptional regulator LsrR (DeoR family)
MHLHTEKQQAYFKEVIRLHYEKGYGAKRISGILPIGHATVSRWIAIFAAKDTGKFVQMRESKTQAQPAPAAAPQVNDVTALQAEVVRLQAQLKHARLRADAYDEMIHVAESKFNIAIRKKAGAKRY